ncbi:hypothetical protein ACJX0J_014125, partial [Zea mays]
PCTNDLRAEDTIGHNLFLGNVEHKFDFATTFLCDTFTSNDYGKLIYIVFNKKLSILYVEDNVNFISPNKYKKGYLSESIFFFFLNATSVPSLVFSNTTRSIVLGVREIQCVSALVKYTRNTSIETREQRRQEVAVAHLILVLSTPFAADWHARVVGLDVYEVVVQVQSKINFTIK